MLCFHWHWIWTSYQEPRPPSFYCLYILIPSAFRASPSHCFPKLEVLKSSGLGCCSDSAFPCRHRHVHRHGQHLRLRQLHAPRAGCSEGEYSISLSYSPRQHHSLYAKQSLLIFLLLCRAECHSMPTDLSELEYWGIILTFSYSYFSPLMLSCSFHFPLWWQYGMTKQRGSIRDTVFCFWLCH